MKFTLFHYPSSDASVMVTQPIVSRPTVLRTENTMRRLRCIAFASTELTARTARPVCPTIGTGHGEGPHRNKPMSASVSFTFSPVAPLAWPRLLPNSRNSSRQNQRGHETSMLPKLSLISKATWLAFVLQMSSVSLAQQRRPSSGSGNDYLQRTEQGPWFTGSCNQFYNM